MQTPRPLEVVFLTNFTDYCYRSIPAVAQMADDFAVRLTIVHALGGATADAEEARTKLQSFFPEADSYPNCRRLVLNGDVSSVVQRLQAHQNVDLLIAPAADPLGLPRIGHRSLRTRLLRECHVPLWTVGRRTKPAKLRIRPRHVGCWIDFRENWRKQAAFAQEYAAKLGATLHLLHALPEVHDGAWLPDQPLYKDGVIEALKQQLRGSATPLQFHVSESDSRRARRKLVENSGVDVLFVADQKPGWPEWLATKPKFLDESVCPVIHVPIETAVPVWQLANTRKGTPVEVTAAHAAEDRVLVRSAAR